MRGLVVGIVAITLLGTGVGIYGAVKAWNAAEGATEIARDVSGGDAPDNASFYLDDDLREGLDELRRELGASAPVDVKIEQRALKVTSSARGGRSVLVTAGGRTIATPAPGLQVAGPRLSEIDPEAVERVARGVARRARIELREIAYITTLSGTDERRWGVYLDGGGRWEARLDGTRLRKVR